MTNAEQIFFHIIPPITVCKPSLTRIISIGVPGGTSKNISNGAVPVNEYRICLLHLQTDLFFMSPEQVYGLPSPTSKRNAVFTSVSADHHLLPSEEVSAGI